MIDSCELRLGNWVYNKDGNPAMIIELFLKEVANNPIPLTPEILEKCGFKKGKLQAGGFFGYDNGKLELNNDFQVGLFDGRMEENDTRSYSPELKYLHQLQNLYFTIIGEELSFSMAVQPAVSERS